MFLRKNTAKGCRIVVSNPQIIIFQIRLQKCPKFHRRNELFFDSRNYRKIYDCYITDNYYPELFNGEFTNIYADGIGVKVSNGEIVITELQLEGKRKYARRAHVYTFWYHGNDHHSR